MTRLRSRVELPYRGVRVIRGACERRYWEAVVVRETKKIENFVAKTALVKARIVTPADERFTLSGSQRRACERYQDEEGRLLASSRWRSM